MDISAEGAAAFIVEHYFQFSTFNVLRQRFFGKFREGRSLHNTTLKRVVHSFVNQNTLTSRKGRLQSI